VRHKLARATRAGAARKPLHTLVNNFKSKSFTNQPGSKG